MPFFRKKPVVIEAMRFTGSNGHEISAWAHRRLAPEANAIVTRGPTLDSLTIRTLEGEHIASAGDWIIKGVKGEFYPCKPDIFAVTYEPADSAHSGRVGGDGDRSRAVAAGRIVHRQTCSSVCCDQDCDGRGLATQEEWDAHEHVYPARTNAVEVTRG